MTEPSVVSIALQAFQPVQIKVDRCRVHQAGLAFDHLLQSVAIEAVAQGKQTRRSPMCSSAPKAAPSFVIVPSSIMSTIPFTRLIGSFPVSGPRETQSTTAVETIFHESSLAMNGRNALIDTESPASTNPATCRYNSRRRSSGSFMTISTAV